MSKFDVIAFDADDTLWHNEDNYRKSENDLFDLLKKYASDDQVMKHLLQRENANIPYYGYGVKSFTLSMIETAIDLSEGKISSLEIQKIIGFARRMIEYPVVLLHDVQKVLNQLQNTRPMIVITKGDLLDQEQKLLRSGLQDYFENFNVVSNKDSNTYLEVFEKYGYNSEKVIMIGNSLKSDVLPVIEIGGWGVHIPYHTTWEHEVLSHNPHQSHERFYELDSIADLPELIHKLNI